MKQNAVVRIDMKPVEAPKPVTQDDLKSAFGLRVLAWKALMVAHDAERILKGRIQSGAKVQRGRYRFDEDFQIVTDGSLFFIESR